VSLAERWRRGRWRLYAPVYDRLAAPFESGRARAVDLLDPGADDRILLVGAGTGLDLPHLPADARVTALDVVPENVRRTRVRADDLDRAVDATVGDATDLPFEDDAFDAVCLHLLLAVVPDPAAVLAAVDRVLAPGGRVSVFDKFLPDGALPSLLRRALNPAARLLFSDLTRQLGPLVAGTDLAVREREGLLWDLYSVALLRPAAESHGRRTPVSCRRSPGRPDHRFDSVGRP